MQELFTESDIDRNEHNNESDLFSVDNDPKVESIRMYTESLSIQIFGKCENLEIVLPLINSEIWNNVYPNIQQRDRTLQDSSMILGLFIVLMMEEMFETNKFEIKKSKKKCLSNVITRACILF